MNRIIVALFRPGKRLPRSPGRDGAAAPAACSQPPPSFLSFPFLGAALCTPITMAMPMCPLPLLLFVASSLPSAGCWRPPGQTRSSSSACRCHGHHTPPNFCPTGATFGNSPSAGGAGPVDEGGRDVGKKCSGMSWQIPMESVVGFGASGPIVLAFPAPLPSTPSRVFHG